MSSKKFTAKEIKKIARSYIFGKNMTYKKLAEMCGCSDSKISYMMNYDLLEYSRILYVLAELKAKAKEKGIKGYTKMTKEELEEAIKEN